MKTKYHQLPFNIKMPLYLKLKSELEREIQEGSGVTTMTALLHKLINQSLGKDAHDSRKTDKI